MMLYPRHGHSASLLPDVRVLLCGGTDGLGGALPASSTILFDPATATWSAGPPLGEARQYAMATPVETGGVLVVGSRAGRLDAWGETLRSVELLHP